jgi:hypothetical protein
MPTAFIEEYEEKRKSKIRDKVYTLSRTIFAMIFTCVQEGKSLQNTVNVFNENYEEECKLLQAQEAACLSEAKNTLKQKADRLSVYKSKLPLSKTKSLSNSTAAYANARKRLPKALLKEIFYQTNKVEDNDCES